MGPIGAGAGPASRLAPSSAPTPMPSAPRAATLAFLLLGALGLAGCGPAVLSRLAPPGAEAASLRAIGLLRAGRVGELEQAFDPGSRTPVTRRSLARMAAELPPGAPESEKLVGVRVAGPAGRTAADLTFECRYPARWLLIDVATRSGTATLVGLDLRPIPDSLEHANGFTLAGESAAHYAILALAAAALALSLAAFVLCLRTPLPRRKWLWILFVVFGFGSVSINWTTGALAASPFAVSLLSANAFHPFYGPWIISASLPVGAIVFLLRRKRLVRPPAR
jgi:hypothetical protein